ncbi:MAG TPA: cyclodeaminase/cyclohydrolase family protein [Candidatus Limnocylindrales bacterium]|nr:cyclodeaminase/cyclohydrolase family protein [Candidatus Limnocylindrales bacterium]
MLNAAERGFLDALAAKSPTPAGGAAAAYAGAMAAALVAMVARTTIGKKGYEKAERRMTKIVIEAEACRDKLVDGVGQDSAAFEAVLAARRLPESDEQKKALENATLCAAQVPLEIARTANEVLKMATEVLQTGNFNALNDAVCAAALADTAVDVSVLNAVENLDALPDNARARRLLKQADRLVLSLDECRLRIGIVMVTRTQGS